MAEAGMRFGKIRRRHKLLGLFRLFRIPNLLLLLLGQVLMVWRFAPFGDSLVAMLESPVFFVLLATQASAAAGYIINDYHDVKIDLINKPSRVVIGRFVTRRKALIVYLLLNLLALASGFVPGKNTGFLVLLSCFLLWRYSVKMKCIPLAGNVLVAFLVALSLFLPALVFGYYPSALFLFTAFAFLSNLIRELVKDLEDYRGDSQQDCRTFATAFGIRASRRLIYVSLILLLLLLVFSVWMNPGFWRMLAMLLFIPFGIFAWQLRKADRKIHFTRLSRLLKWAMLAGTLGILLV